MTRRELGIGATLLVSIAALGLAACADGTVEQVAQQPATQPAEQEVRLIARLSPAAGPPGDAVQPPPGAGEMLQLRSDLSRQERELVYSLLPEKVELSGGIDAAPIQKGDVDLNGDGIDEAIIFVKSGPYCGSGDVCNFWMFQQTESGWRQINENDDAARALEILPGRTDGYADIRLHGFCGGEGCEFIFAWDGTHYQWVNDPTPGPGA